MTLRPISRRSMLVAAFSGGAAWIAGYIPFVSAFAFSKAATGNGNLMTLCSDLRCPKTIGIACLRALPAEDCTRSSLTRTLLDDLGPPAQWRRPNGFAQAVLTRCRADFGEGKVVDVEGWILSVTETRLFALATLLGEGIESVG